MLSQNTTFYLPRAIRSLKLVTCCLLLLLAVCLLRPDPTRAQGPFPLSQFNAWTSSDGDRTESVAWGDMDGDGDLDLAVGNGINTANKVYLNRNGVLETTAVWVSNEHDWTRSVAWGDVDGDGDLDLAVGNDLDPNRVYLNQNGLLETSAAWSSADSDQTQSVAWGDVDGDGDLDLAVGNNTTANRLYLNQNGMLETTAVWVSTDSAFTFSVAWGDVDGDGDLDLAAGDRASAIKIYKNQNGMLETSAGWSSGESDSTYSVAWGDVDGDGDLDLAAGNGYSKVYVNRNGDLETTASWISADNGWIESVAWGDVDGDGDLDLAVGNGNLRVNKVYLNRNGVLETNAAWDSGDLDQTNSVAWGDVDGDGDLDLAAGNAGRANKVYLNQNGVLQTTASWTSGDRAYTRDLAWGDMDGDGDLDLAAGNDFNSLIYLNRNGVLTTTVAWTAVTWMTESVAWGDVDRDGDLDLATGNGNSNKIYLNQNGMLETTAVWNSDDSYVTNSVAWGDLDGDGDLDLAAGSGRTNKVYLNRDGMLETTASWDSGDWDSTESVAWGDLDGDGDLDLAAGNGINTANKVYLNRDGVLETAASWNSGDSDSTYSIAWGDLDGDGDLDLAAGNDGQANKVYLNRDGVLETTASWNSGDSDSTYSIAWGDVDGDGDLDLAAGNRSSANKVYLNWGGALQTAAVWIADTPDWTESVAWGDVDGDGDMDLAAGNIGDANQLYLNGRSGRSLANNPPVITISRPLTTSSANFYSSSIVGEQQIIPITYTLSDPEGELVGWIEAEYSLNGGGQWRPAVAAANTITTNLAAAPLGVTHVYSWDTFASGFFGQSDNVVLRMVAYPQPSTPAVAGVYRYPNTAPGPFQRPYASAATFPFRLRGTQVQVLSGTRPISNAYVYRLPRDEAVGGFLLGQAGSQPFTTDNNGYLTGRGRINTGDRLLALAPAPLPPAYTARFSDSLRLYYTNVATITEDGLQSRIHNSDSLTVTQPGVQQLVVSANYPLMLFDLDVSLEWNASRDPVYLQQLQLDLQRASEYLYDFTDGQVALGRITVSQNADDWAYTHVNVHATNRLRPFAVIGGIVLTDTLDPQHVDLKYDIGQVHLGATWNRYGNPGNNLGQDWPLILAHELGHFLLFQEDTYLGLDAGDLLIAVDDCQGSAMGDVYSLDNTEFVGAAAWLPACAETLAHKALTRSEWETIGLWYPWLHPPGSLNPGPSQMPFDFTEITLLDPLTPTNALDDPTFYLDYQGGSSVVSSSEARAFLFRNKAGTTAATANEFEYLYDLGSPIGGQNQLLAWGAQPGDRLCVFDPPRRQSGCEVIRAGDERLALALDPTWQPVIQISPVTSTSFGVQVEGVAAGLSLEARIFPEFGEAFAIQSLSEGSPGLYGGLVTLTEPALVGQLQLWSSGDPRRESVVSYSIGGNPGNRRGSGGGDVRAGGGNRRGSGGGDVRGGGGNRRGSGGGDYRTGDAPLVSPDGQMIFFATGTITFPEGSFYTVQNMAALPPLPAGKTAIGQGYNLFATPTAPALIGSISFQYLGNDVLVEGKSEAELAIHYWTEAGGWQSLATKVDERYNLASAHSRGAGIYALLAGRTVPGVSAVVPAQAVAMTSTQIFTVTGGYYLSPTLVMLTGPTATYTLPTHLVNTGTLRVEIPPSLPAREYQVWAANGSQPDGPAVSPLPGTFALFDASAACFYDFFESGAGRWQVSGDWGIVILPSGERAMTDSPLGSYQNAEGWAAGALHYTTAITTQPFSLTSTCVGPALSFRHDYIIDNRPPSQDIGRIEISTDSGLTWQELASYQGGYQNLIAGDVPATEWTNPTWQPEQLSLAGYTGTVRLRFSLTVDRVGSDKGWLIDDLRVTGGSTPPEKRFVFLPVLMK